MLQWSRSWENHMIRFVGLVLIAWGLIVQPLMASMPAPINGSNSHASMTLDSNSTSHLMGPHSDQHSGDTSQAPCHESSPDPCDNCNTDCMEGVCTSPCGGSGMAAFHKSIITPFLLVNASLLQSSRAPTYALPSRIFHPPKHS